MSVESTAIFNHSYSVAEMPNLLDDISKGISINNFYEIYLDIASRYKMDALRSNLIRSFHKNWEWNTSLAHNISDNISNPLWVIKIWEDEQDTLRLIGPCFLQFNVTRYCIYYTDGLWTEFLLNPDIQFLYRTIYQEISRVLKSLEVIYIPDSSYTLSRAIDMVDEGLQWNSIKGILEKQFGPPALSLEAIAYEYDYNHYFIDSFEKF
jgi:hypothetical protein